MKKYLVIIFIVFLITGCKGKTYTVTFIDSKTELARIEVKKGDTLKDINIPTKEGYLFLNWLKDGLDYNTDSPITEDITLEASWTPIPDLIDTYTVTFNFGDDIKTVNVKEGEKVEKPKKDPHKDKYKFIGWYLGDKLYDFNTPVDKEITLEAKFEKNRIVINYDLAGGTGTVQVEIDKGSIPTKPKNPSKFGYTFINWKIDNIDVPLYEDTKITANYEANIYYKVTFDSDGGNEVASQMIIAGHAISSLPGAKKEGYNFKYWTYNGEQFDINMEINSDITLVALYEKIE